MEATTVQVNNKDHIVGRGVVQSFVDVGKVFILVDGLQVIMFVGKQISDMAAKPPSHALIIPALAQVRPNQHPCYGNHGHHRRGLFWTVCRS